MNISKSYCLCELKKALKQDDRILGVEDFEFKQIDKKSLSVSFVVNSIFGNIQIGKGGV